MKRIMVIVIALYLAGTPSFAGMLGQRGKLYPIAEKSFLEEVKELASGKQITLKKEDIQNWHPAVPALPKATKPDSFDVDISWTADKDYLPNPADGSILYQAGYTFNPAALVKYPYIRVIIDADDEKQLEWFVNSPYASNIRVRLDLSGGSWFKTYEYLEKRKITTIPVFYLPELMAQRFHLRAVPCAVFQEGTHMKVVEYVPGDAKAVK